MRHLSLQRGIRIVLAVGILLGGTVPPGVCHSHEGGALPHRHDGRRVVRHDGDDRHQHEPAGHAHAHDESLVSERAPHVHLNVFGFEITLPIPDRARDDGQDQQANGPSLVAVVSDSPAIVGQNLNTSSSLLLPPAASPDSFGCARYDCNHSVKSAEACAIPLCDSARRERTGVLVV